MIRTFRWWLKQLLLQSFVVLGGACGRCQSATPHPAASCERCPITRGSSEGVDTAAPGQVVNRVPGNLHLWTYSHAYLFSSSCQETQDINVSHHVDHVCFTRSSEYALEKLITRSCGTCPMGCMRFVKPHGCRSSNELNVAAEETHTPRRFISSLTVPLCFGNCL